MTTFRDLEAWQCAMSLVERCYAITKTFPPQEQFGIISQIRRAAVSIPANLAEGACRKSAAVFRHHVAIALGSQAELETCLEIARRLGYVSESAGLDVNNQCALTG